ncbi:hypothetical protein [Streptomyces sp. NPDC018693]|uniref:hypothetical protein n=1 Tax=unclassified Streptomyces TaxID=2593676 RepID=UPI0037B7BB11
MIPAETAAATRRAYCAAGIPTQSVPYPGDHLLTDPMAVHPTLTWLAARFLGSPSSTTC